MSRRCNEACPTELTVCCTKRSGHTGGHSARAPRAGRVPKRPELDRKRITWPNPKPATSTEAA